MRIRFPASFAVVSLFSSACSIAPPAAPSAPQDEPPLARVTRAFDGRTHSEMTLDDALDRAAHSDVVFLGETHLDETTHRVELRALERLARRPGGVVLTMEMFERDVQPALDDYLAGRIDEKTFLARARPWTNYRTAYRPLVEFAKAHHVPVIAGNVPADLRRKISQGGRAAFDALSADEKKNVAATIQPENDAYWTRVDNAVRGHAMGGGGGSPDERLFSGQSLWDNTMAESIAHARETWLGAVVLQVNGGFHSSRFDGTVHQLRLRDPHVSIATIEVEPSSDLAAVDPRGGPLLADFLVFTEARGRDLSDGTYAVTIGAERPYRLHVPAGASDAARVPLVVVLADDGLAAGDTLALWKTRLGDAAAVAVIDHLFAERGADLGEGGTFVRADSFDDDISLAMRTLDATLAHVLRGQPVDPARVAILGERANAVPVLAAATRLDRFCATFVALDPAGITRLGELSLPTSDGEPVTPAPFPPTKRSVLVIGADDDATESALADAKACGLDGRCATPAADADAVARDDFAEDAIRGALGLATRTHGARSAAPAADSARAREWTRIAAARGADLTISAKAFSTPGRLPLAPGPFGGTTIVVVDFAAPQAEKDAWKALVANDPVNQHSRFHRLRVATSDDELEKLLAQLATENRKNLLIVPAEFCATPDRMQHLKAIVDAAPGERTVAWSPGLGARLEAGAMP